MPRRSRGCACCGSHDADDQAGADGAALDGERVEQCVDGAAASRTTAPGSQAQASQSQASRRRGHAGERGGDCGRILVTVVSTSRLLVVAGMSRARWPRSCGCLHRGSHAQAVNKTSEATHSHVLIASASCVARGGPRASRRAHSWGRRGSGRRACACASAACAPVAREAAVPTESCARCMRGC